MRKVRQAVVLCGGKGTRLGEKARGLPKPLVPVEGVALLDRTLQLLSRHGIGQALLAAGYKGEAIARHYRENPQQGIEVRVEIEPKPMGTAGALPLYEVMLEETFLVVYGDIFLDFDVSRLTRAHLARGADCLATLLVRESDHPWDSQLVVAGEDGRVEEFVFEQEEGKRYPNLGNAAFYACNRRLLEYIPRNKPSDFGRDVFPHALERGEEIFSCRLEPGGFVRDMGTPERLALVERYIRRRRKAKTARENPRPVKAAFIDRDGTLNVEKGHVTRAEDLELLPGAGEALALLQKNGVRCFLLTNQPVIARGLCSQEDLEAIHLRLGELLAESGGSLDAIYYCPHHPETQHGEGIKELRRGCDCRKPASGMIFEASEVEEIDLAEAVMIGDTIRDVLAGKHAGLRTFYVGAPGKEGEMEADYAEESVLTAARRIVDELV